MLPGSQRKVCLGFSYPPLWEIHTHPQELAHSLPHRYVEFFGGKHPQSQVVWDIRGHHHEDLLKEGRVPTYLAVLNWGVNFDESIWGRQVNWFFPLGGFIQQWYPQIILFNSSSSSWFSIINIHFGGPPFQETSTSLLMIGKTKARNHKSTIFPSNWTVRATFKHFLKVSPLIQIFVHLNGLLGNLVGPIRARAKQPAKASSSSCFGNLWRLRRGFGLILIPAVTIRSQLNGWLGRRLNRSLKGNIHLARFRLLIFCIHRFGGQRLGRLNGLSRLCGFSAFTLSNDNIVILWGGFRHRTSRTTHIR